MIKALSATQTVVALSSGESEFYANVRGTAVGLGMKSMYMDLLGTKFKLDVLTDASAGHGMLLRQGAGKIQHLHAQYLWVQGVMQRGEAVSKKIPGNENEADLLTKHLAGPRMEQLVRKTDNHNVSGVSRTAWGLS